MTNFALLL